MKRKMLMLMLLAAITGAAMVTLMGCPEEQEEEVPVSPEIVEPPPAGEVIEGVPEAIEETYTNEPAQPGMEELPPPTEEELQNPPVGDADQAPPADE